MSSEEFRRNLPVVSSSLPNLVVQRPEKYRRVICTKAAIELGCASGAVLQCLDELGIAGDEEGYPIHGHLAWADAGWWTTRFEEAGFTRDVDVERAFHAKYDSYMEKRSPARRAYFVFGKKATAARRAAVVERISAASKLL